MKNTLSIASIQEAAHTVSELHYAPLMGFQQNRIAQVMNGLELPDSPEDLELYALVRDAVEQAYLMGFHDSRLTLGEL